MNALILAAALVTTGQCPGGQCPTYAGNPYAGFEGPPRGYKVPPLTDPSYNPYRNSAPASLPKTSNGGQAAPAVRYVQPSRPVYYYVQPRYYRAPVYYFAPRQCGTNGCR